MSQKAKNKYRVRNWSQYNKSLINRGSITFWFNEETVQNWNAPKHSGQRGRPQIYSDAAILCALILRFVFHLNLRATQGYITSLIQLMGLALQCPHYTLMCRRAQHLKIPLQTLRSQEPLHIVVDSTGLKVYGEGEWKVRKHGYSKRRTWRKVHIGMCAKTQQILVSALSSNDVSDESVLPELLNQIVEPIEAVGGDGAYDVSECYGAIFDAGAKPIIPPRVNAVRRREESMDLQARNQAIERIEELGGGEEGRRLWKQESGYHKRSLAETAMYRLKVMLGDKLRGRKFSNQAIELFVKCAILNKMSELGLPESYAIAV